MSGVLDHESLEDAWSITTGNLSPLSEQQTADCVTVGSTCQNGLMDNGFDSVEKNDMYMAGRSVQFPIFSQLPEIKSCFQSSAGDLLCF